MRNAEANLPNRKDVRHMLANALTGTLKSLQVVYPNEPEIAQGQTPIGYLTSAGSSRVKFTAQGLSNVFYFELHVLVLSSKEEEGYTVADSEDILDDIEKEVAVFIANNDSRDGLWLVLEQEEASNARTAVIENGEKYIQEITTLKVRAV